jgi:hypothetical protein
MLRVCNFFVVFVIKYQQFSDGMKDTQGIEGDVVYVNMTGQSPNFLFLSFTKNNSKETKFIKYRAIERKLDFLNKLLE